MKDAMIVRGSDALVDSEKRPLAPVIVPVLVPRITRLTPASGWSFSSVTTPARVITGELVPC
jgi:hypothetical protein